MRSGSFARLLAVRAERLTRAGKVRRDRVGMGEAHPAEDVFEARKLDITSQMEISEEDALWLEELALAGRIR